MDGLSKSNRVGTIVKIVSAVTFLLCVGIFVLLRLRWIPHLLAWDEAMNICTVRSFVSGGEDPFSSWFWRHPPLFCLLMTLCGPLSSGFVERVEFMVVLIGVLNLGLLYLLNRKIYNERMALLSAFFLAVMPGSVFFGVWVKRDHGVQTFGLIALLFITSGKFLYGGIALGIALLFKETAVFYVGCALLLYGLSHKRDRWLRGLFFLGVIPVLLSSWWYVLFGKILVNLKMASSSGAGVWQKGFFYYFSHLPTDIGVLPLVMTVLGLPLWIWLAGKRSVLKFWPFVILLPSYMLLSILPGKVPWIVICLFPAWATVVAAGADGFWVGSVHLFKSGQWPRFIYRLILPAVASLILGIIVYQSFCRSNYVDVFRMVDEGQCRGARYSRECAEAVNSRISEGDRLLLTSFYYWKGLSPGSACAVFCSYLDGSPPILLRSHKLTSSDYISDIRKFSVDWALLSPEPGSDSDEIFGGLMRESGMVPVALEGAYLFDTGKMINSYEE